MDREGMAKALLISNSSKNLDNLKEKLEFENISFLKFKVGAGGYGKILRGEVAWGEKIYVRDEDFQRALDLIKSI